MTKNWKTILKVAESRLKKGNFDGAILACDRIINWPENEVSKEIRVEAFITRGTAYVKKGDIDRALNDSDKVIELAPGNVTALHNRALVYGSRAARASEKKFREEYEQELQKIRKQSKQDAQKSREQLQQVREQSEQDTQKLREELRQASEQSEQDAEKLRAQFAEKLRAQFDQFSDPDEIINLYKLRESKYNGRIEELAREIKTFANKLQISLILGLVGALLIVSVIFWQQPGDKLLGIRHGLALVSLTLAWLAANYPAIGRLGDLRKEKRKMEICVEDYFRKLTLVIYTLASEGDERKKMMAVTHAHFVTRSTAEFLADWNPPSDSKPHPMLDVIEKIRRRKDDDSPPKPPEAKPSA